MQFRDAVRYFRGEAGLTQMELASILHTNSTTIGRWENGRNLPNRTIAAVLREYACTVQVSRECRDSLLEAISGIAKEKLAIAADNLYSVEHETLSSLVDDASFPIYVCDLKSYRILYLNKKAEELIGSPFEKNRGKLCYECLMNRDAPCPSCHKESLEHDRFVGFDIIRPVDGRNYHVQGKLIRWNGCSAQVRYATELGKTVSISNTREREIAYGEQLRVRKNMAGDALASVHYNLTHNTITDMSCKNDRLGRLIAKRSIDDILMALGENTFTQEELEIYRNIQSREALIRQFYTGTSHISVKNYIKSLSGYFEGTFDLLQNPVTFDIEAFATLRDITEATITQDIVNRLLGVDYETITTIDAQTGEAHPYLGNHIEEVIAEQKIYGNIAGVEQYLRKHCVEAQVDRIIEETSLPYVKRQLEKGASYSIAYSLVKGEKVIRKRTVYTYLDQMQTTILCAMQDITDLYHMTVTCCEHERQER